MMLALLLAAAAPTTAVEAERAFAADAQRLGQWTAFRKWADPTAVMWTPQAVWAHDFLKDRKDPAVAVRWQLSHSWQSCDRRTAVNLGPWSLPGSRGRWITLWMRQPSGDWRWTADGQLKPVAPAATRGSQPRVRVASCRNAHLRARHIEAAYAASVNRTAPPGDSGYARSADGTLLFNWTVSAEGVRRTRAQLWTGRRFELVHDETTPAVR
jgi:hypothetical protein